MLLRNLEENVTKRTIELLKEKSGVLKIFWDEGVIKDTKLSNKYWIAIEVFEYTARQRIVCGLYELYSLKLADLEKIVTGMNSCNWQLIFELYQKEINKYNIIMPIDKLEFIPGFIYTVGAIVVLFLNCRYQIFPYNYVLVAIAICALPAGFYGKRSINNFSNFEKKALRIKRERKRIEVLKSNKLSPNNLTLKSMLDNISDSNDRQAQRINHFPNATTVHQYEHVGSVCNHNYAPEPRQDLAGDAEDFLRLLIPNLEISSNANEDQNRDITQLKVRQVIDQF
ncbi:hypothetical protein B7486_35070 [cyanobacterium TDX16]|nr:hypothetical protein B7486_35070 [cyanobacterium TDX16]